jgi:hypothetical protein
MRGVLGLCGVTIKAEETATRCICNGVRRKFKRVEAACLPETKRGNKAMYVYQWSGDISADSECFYDILLLWL